MRTPLLAVFLSACVHTSGAPSTASPDRSAELRAEYPPGKTSRTDVLARQGQPQVVLTRPSTGWASAFVLEAEQRSGALIARAEKYVSPTGTSAGLLTLAHVWFFYDRADVLVDVVWERMGD